MQFKCALKQSLHPTILCRPLSISQPGSAKERPICSTNNSCRQVEFVFSFVLYDSPQKVIRKLRRRIMDVWFEFSERTFEVFFEMKLELYHTASCDVAKEFDDTTRNAVLKRAMLDELRVLPTSFIDGADEITQRVYFSLPSGFGSPGTTTSSESEADVRNSDLYGELTPQGVRTMLQLAGFGSSLNPNSDLQGAAGSSPGTKPLRFVDLGSGTGKVVTEVALCLGLGRATPDSVRSIGVEYLEHRHQVAVAAQKLLTSTTPADDAELRRFLSTLTHPLRETLSTVATQSIEFRHGSFLDPAVLPPPDVEPVHLFFCCGVGFGREMIAEICELISRFVVHHGAAGFRGALLLFKERPHHPLFDSFCSVRVVKVQSTWMEETPAYWLEPQRLLHHVSKATPSPTPPRPSIEAAD
jgi:hypothetical protein